MQALRRAMDAKTHTAADWGGPVTLEKVSGGGDTPIQCP